MAVAAWLHQAAWVGAAAMEANQPRQVCCVSSLVQVLAVGKLVPVVIQPRQEYYVASLRAIVPQPEPVALPPVYSLLCYD